MKTVKLFPGMILSVLIAAFAVWLERLLPVHLIGAAVIAMFIGMILNRFLQNLGKDASSVSWFSRVVLIGEENGVELITAEHKQIINAKRKRNNT
jgi:uncharacterized membrane protein YadS